jgi:hypothetical protein
MKTAADLLKQDNPLLYYFGLLCLVGAGLCLALTQLTHVPVSGTNAWYKPFKFLLSTTLFVWSMGWYMQHLDHPVTVRWYSWGVIALLGFENGYIFLQAARGQQSHFNVSTPFYASMWSLMAVAAVVVSIWTAYIGALFFQRLPGLSPTYLWGIRMGILLFVLFSMEGLAMGARLAHTMGGPDGSPGLPVLNWSRQHGDLRIAHFLGMHALQVIPLFAYYGLSSVASVIGFSALYGLSSLWLFLQALQGKPLF